MKLSAQVDRQTPKAVWWELGPKDKDGKRKRRLVAQIILRPTTRVHKCGGTIMHPDLDNVDWEICEKCAVEIKLREKQWTRRRNREPYAS